MEKKHYSKVYKSDYLSSEDLKSYQEMYPDSNMVFVIKDVKQFDQVSVAGRNIAANIVYFEENIKPLVLNKTNALVLRKFANSGFISEWKGLAIKLYIDSKVKFGKEVVSGVRISSERIYKVDSDVESKHIARVSKMNSNEELKDFAKKLIADKQYTDKVKTAMIAQSKKIK